MNFSSERWHTIDTLFETALDHPPGDRDAFLRERCGEDRELYETVKALLAASDESSFLEKPVHQYTHAFWQAFIDDLTRS